MPLGDKIALGCVIVLGIVFVLLLIFRSKLNDFFNRNNEAYMKKKGKKQTAAGKKYLTAFLDANPRISEIMVDSFARGCAECIVHNQPMNNINPTIVSKIRSNWQFHVVQSMHLEDIDPISLDLDNDLLTVSANFTNDSSKLFLCMKVGMFNNSLTLYDCDLLDAAELGF